MYFFFFFNFLSGLRSILWSHWLLLFWTSCVLPHGFQIQSGYLACTLSCLHAVILKVMSGVTPAFSTNRGVHCISVYTAWQPVAGIRSADLPHSEQTCSPLGYRDRLVEIVFCYWLKIHFSLKCWVLTILSQFFWPENLCFSFRFSRTSSNLQANDSNGSPTTFTHNHKVTDNR